MPKTKESAALGHLSDFTSAPQQETDTARITALERRVATLEGLLSDVMVELDKAHSQPKVSKQQVNSPPKAKSKSPKPSDAGKQVRRKHQMESERYFAESRVVFVEYINGVETFTRDSVHESTGLSKNMCARIIKKLLKGGLIEKVDCEGVEKRTYRKVTPTPPPSSQ